MFDECPPWNTVGLAKFCLVPQGKRAGCVFFRRGMAKLGHPLLEGAAMIFSGFNQRTYRFIQWAVVGTLILGCWVLLAQQAGQVAKSRVAPKTYKPGEGDPPFFSDVFQIVIGERPNLGTAGTGSPTPSAGGIAASSSTGSQAALPPAVAGGPWQRLISAEVLENEVKAAKSALDKAVTTPSDFAGRGYKICRTQFTQLAVLFAVINEYDGAVRWKADAAAARDAFSRTAANCKVGSTQAFNEAKQRKADLEELIRGNPFPQKSAATENDWSSIADRSPMMIRLQTAFDDHVRKYTSSDAEFRSSKEKLLSEAQIIALIAEVLCKPGMEDASDSTYTGFARKMQSEALRVIEATKSGDVDQARQAAGQIDQACSTCHESYRG